MQELYKTKEAAEFVARKEFGEAIAVGEHWIICPILLTVDEVASLLDCSKRKVWQMRVAGDLPDTVHPTPGKTRWRLGDIKRLTY